MKKLIGYEVDFVNGGKYFFENLKQVRKSIKKTSFLVKKITRIEQQVNITIKTDATFAVIGGKK